MYLNLEEFGVVDDVGWLNEVLLDGQRQRVFVDGGRDDEARRARLWRLAQLVDDLGRPEQRPMIVHVSYLYSHLYR